jgi:hypothetical protein
MFIQWFLVFLFLFLGGLFSQVGTAYASTEIQSYLVSTSDFNRADISTKFYLNTPLLSPDYEKSFEEQKLQVEKLARFLCHLNLVAADDCQITRWVGPNYTPSEMEQKHNIESYKLIVKNQYFYNLQISAESTKNRLGSIHLLKTTNEKHLQDYCSPIHKKELKQACSSLCKSECEIIYNESLSLEKLNRIKYDIPIQWLENINLSGSTDCLNLSKLYCPEI